MAVDETGGRGPGHATCPSAPPRAGAVLLGVMGPNGRMAYVPSGPTVDQGMLDALVADDPDAVGYRFAGPCLTSGCVYWAGTRCHVPDKVRLDRERAGLPAAVPTDELPDCAIRPTCRWWRQDGAQACALCPLVSTRQPGRTSVGPDADRASEPAEQEGAATAG